MLSGDQFYVMMGIEPRHSLHYIVNSATLYHGEPTRYDMICTRCRDRIVVPQDPSIRMLRTAVGGEHAIHIININNIVDPGTRNLLRGHRRRCWQERDELNNLITSIPIGLPMSVTAMMTTGTTGTTGWRGAQGGLVNPAPVRGYGEMIQNKIVNMRKKKKIKLPEFRLIRDD